MTPQETPSAPGSPGEDWTEPDRPEVWFGARSEHVRALQEQLARIGLYDDAWGEIPGAFGPRTDAALRAFQEQAGITVDGICDPVTWLNLYAWQPERG